MAAVEFNIKLQRNADWRRELAIVDDLGDPLDLTGATFKLEVKYREGDPDPPLATANITVVDAPGGIIEAHLSGDQFAAVPGANELVNLAYDLIGTQDGDDTALARGYVILTPGVS